MFLPDEIELQVARDVGKPLSKRVFKRVNGLLETPYEWGEDTKVYVAHPPQTEAIPVERKTQTPSTVPLLVLRLTAGFECALACMGMPEFHEWVDHDGKLDELTRNMPSTVLPHLAAWWLTQKIGWPVVALPIQTFLGSQAFKYVALPVVAQKRGG